MFFFCVCLDVKETRKMFNINKPEDKKKQFLEKIRNNEQAVEGKSKNVSLAVISTNIII